MTKSERSAAAGAPETDAAYIVRAMRELGFRPEEGHSAGSVTFYKDYADGPNRVVRVRAFLERPIANVGTIFMPNFGITVQLTIPATREEVQSNTTGPLREDLERVLKSMERFSIPDQSVALKLCKLCELEKSDWFIVNNEVICRDCTERA